MKSVNLILKENSSVIYVITDKEVSFLKRLLELINYFVYKTEEPRGEWLNISFPV